MKCEWDMLSVVDLVVCMGVFNGHVGKHIDKCYDAHGENSAGQRNLEEYDQFRL